MPVFFHLHKMFLKAGRRTFALAAFGTILMLLLIMTNFNLNISWSVF